MKESRNSKRRSQLPVCVITGFLGAGKTSLLNHFLSSDHGLRVGVIVNDFGAIDIDSQLVENVTEDTISLRNGCICCSMQKDFFDALLKLGRQENPPEVVVIEASGVSDPRTIVLTLTEPGISNFVRVDSVIAVVDSDSFDALGEDESKLAAAQIGISDLVVFNKTDLVDETQLKKNEARVRKMAPLARFFRTVHGRLPVAALLSWDSVEPGESQPASSVKSNFPGASIDASTIQTIEPLTPAMTTEMAPAKNTSTLSPLLTPRQQPGAEAETLHDTFDSCAFVIEPRLSMDKVRDTIMNLPLDIYRLKGLFHVDANPDKQLLVQVVGPRISAAEVKPWGEKPKRSEIVAIGLKGSVDEAHLKSTFESCIATPGNEFLKGLKERVQFWRRGKSPGAVTGD